MPLRLKPRDQQTIVFAAGNDGQTRYRFEPSRPFSLYTGSVLHPGLGWDVLALIGIGAVATAQCGARR